jgi:hypothetical protein
VQRDDVRRLSPEHQPEVRQASRLVVEPGGEGSARGRVWEGYCSGLGPDDRPSLDEPL